MHPTSFVHTIMVACTHQRILKCLIKIFVRSFAMKTLKNKLARLCLVLIFGHSLRRSYCFRNNFVCLALKENITPSKSKWFAWLQITWTFLSALRIQRHMSAPESKIWDRFLFPMQLFCFQLYTSILDLADISNVTRRRFLLALPRLRWILPLFLSQTEWPEPLCTSPPYVSTLGGMIDYMCACVCPTK